MSWFQVTAVGALCALTATFGQNQAVGTSSIRGRIVDEQRQTIPGLVISVERVDADATQRPLVKTGMTGVDGHFEIGALPAGTYQILLGRGYARSAVISFPLPGIGGLTARPIVRSLRPGDSPGSRRADFITDDEGRFVEYNAPVFTRDGRTFAFGAPAIALQVDLGADDTKAIDAVAYSRPAFLVTGYLTGAVPGGAVNDAIVTVSDTRDGPPLMQAFTDFDGRFGIPAVPAGHYVVSARRGICPASTSVDADGWPSRFQCDVGRGDPQLWSGTATVDLDEHGTLTVDGRTATDIHLEMKPTAAGPSQVPGRQPQVQHLVRHGSGGLDGVVTDADQHPLPFTRVAIFSADLGGTRATVTDDQGRFAFHNLPAVSVRLLAAPPGGPALEYGGTGPGTDGSFIAIPDRRQIHIAWQLPR